MHINHFCFCNIFSSFFYFLILLIFIIIAIISQIIFHSHNYYYPLRCSALACLCINNLLKVQLFRSYIHFSLLSFFFFCVCVLLYQNFKIISNFLLSLLVQQKKLLFNLMTITKKKSQFSLAHFSSNSLRLREREKLTVDIFAGSLLC